MAPIYLDNNATTRTDPRVVEAMLPYFFDVYGNASSSSHAFGWAAEEAVERARQEVADLIGAQPREIVFTSGATEACNLALKGVADAFGDRPVHIITQATEHPAVLETLRTLIGRRVRITVLSVDNFGRVAPGDIEAALCDDTIMVAVMAANNEIGTLQPVAEIGRLCADRAILFMTDATQAAGKIPVDVAAWNAHLLALSAHKFHGPKGVGALYIRSRNPRVRIACQMDGGGQERGRRSGTLNVTGIVGMGAAARLCRESINSEPANLARMRNNLVSRLVGGLGPGAKLVGHPEARLPNNASIFIPGVEAEALLAALPHIALSTGSACASAAVKPSHVLGALPDGHILGNHTIRLGVSRFTTSEEIDTAVGGILQVVQKLRAMSYGTMEVSGSRV